MSHERMSVGFRRCGQGHILGQIRQNGDGLAVLALFGQAVDYGEDVPEAVEVIAVIESAKAIRCSICGEVSDWHLKKRARKAEQPSEGAEGEIMEKMREK